MIKEENIISIPKLPIYLYNSESRKKEIFTPQYNNHVKMYTCGPTVYHFAHIGNFRTYVFEDLLRRTLKFFGYQVTQVMNLTDVDDKTIRNALNSHQTLAEFTQPFKNAFFADIQTLGIERVENYPAATDYIPYMIDFIQVLLDKGVAYQSRDKSIYYGIDKFPPYGRLSHLKLDELKVGAGESQVAYDEYDKENATDFVLWKAYDPARDGSIFWNSPFGPGRPGWHLECSTMAMHLLGDTIDIHVGAVDNIFPHHENEIAQSEAMSGKQFVRFWLHSEHLIVNNRKMSKSLGNFYTLRDILQKGFTGMHMRYMLMHIHYRTQLNFTFEALEGAKTSLERMNDFVLRVQEVADHLQKPTGILRPRLKEALHAFATALADDLNISVALSSLFDLIHEVNIIMAQNQLNGGDAVEVLYVLEEFNRVLGFLNFEQEEPIPPYLQEILLKREEARRTKSWQLADSFRNEIQAAGYVIEDTSHGARLKKAYDKR
jgi:cysteinyl-tRNA synthetase